MVRESWELWADDYQERDEGKFDYAEEYTKDDITVERGRAKDDR